MAGEEQTLFFREGLDDAKLTERGWYDGDKFNVTPRETYAGKGSLECYWRQGATTPNTSAIRHLFGPSDAVYVRFYLKLSKGWGWTGRGYHPHLINILTTENGRFHGPAASHLTLYVEPCNGKLRLAAQDIQNKDQPHGLTQGPLRGGYNGKFYDSQEVVFQDGAWHCIEAYFRLNTLDRERNQPKADGVVQGWIDGKLVVDRSDVVLRSTDFPKMQFNQFLLAPYFGPGLLPHEQTLWIDELVVGAERLEPMPARNASE